MAWRDNLRPASFRGVPFAVDTASLTAGRRLARHEYPQRDLPYMEDMGRKAREYRVEAFIVGADYMSGRDALLKAIEQAGPGQLVHPYYGTLQVVVSDTAQLSESTREGGIVKVTINFVESGRKEEPRSDTDTEAVLDAQHDDTELAISDEFATSYSVNTAPDFVTDDALSSVNDLLALPAMALGNLDWIRANTFSKLRALLPENLLSALSAPASLATGILSLVRDAGNMLSLFDFSLPQLPVTGTESRQLQADNRQALVNLVQQAAAARRIVDLGKSSPATLDDARAMRAEIVSRADAVLLMPSVSQQTSDAIVQLRTDAIRHFMRQSADLPRLVSITRNAVQPAIVAVHDFYGDDWQTAGRDDEFVARNRVRHPGFVPAGVWMQYLSE